MLCKYENQFSTKQSVPVQKVRQDIPVLDLDLLEKSAANLRATPRQRKIKKDIYYTLKRARSQLHREDSQEILQ